MPKLKELLQETKVTIQLSDDVTYDIDEEVEEPRYGDMLCLVTAQTNPDIIEVPRSLYEQGYGRVVTTIGKEGNLILYLFKRGKYVRKFISDFNYLKLETFVGYNEIPFEKFTGEEARELMEKGKIMKLDGCLYRMDNGILYIKNNSSHADWKQAKKKHIDRTEWLENK